MNHKITENYCSPAQTINNEQQKALNLASNLINLATLSKSITSTEPRNTISALIFSTGVASIVQLEGVGAFAKSLSKKVNKSMSKSGLLRVFQLQ